jgi:hypothetical protein
MRTALLCTLLALLAPAYLAHGQQSGRSDTTAASRARGYDPFLTWATVWGDQAREGVYTCEEWKRYAGKLFDDADRNRDGFVDAQEFQSIRKADKMLRDADLAYFDDNRDGRLSKAEFVNKPNPFFARYDRKGKCRVTLDEITDALAAEQKPAAARNR